MPNIKKEKVYARVSSLLNFQLHKECIIPIFEDEKLNAHQTNFEVLNHRALKFRISQTSFDLKMADKCFTEKPFKHFHTSLQLEVF